MRTRRRALSALPTLLIWGALLTILPRPASGQSVALIDYPAAVILHPLMTTFQFQKGRFERAPLLAKKETYEEWVAKVSREIQALREKHRGELDNRQKKLERLERSALQLREKHLETINALSLKFDALRTSQKPEDKAVLNKVQYGAQIQNYEEKFQRDLALINKEIETARAALKELEEIIESPRYLTSTQTRELFARIEQEIIKAAQYVMQTKGANILLNSTGMGPAVSNTPIMKLDPETLARHSDLELSFYKLLLSDGLNPPQQTYANPEYQKQMERAVFQNTVASLRKGLQARSGLRLVEPDLVPRVLLGGIPITIETVNYLLYQYQVPEGQRALLIQALREMGIQ